MAEPKERKENKKQDKEQKQDQKQEKNIVEPFKEDFGVFIEAGFVAVKQLDEQKAINLFHAAQVLDPKSPAPCVGLGYIALNKLEIKEAEKKLKEALEMDPDHHLAQAFLGITYLLSEPNRKQGEKLLKEVMKKTNDPTVKSLGKTSLEWAKQDLKKKKAPFFGGSD